MTAATEQPVTAADEADGQSLATGGVGVALLAIERALTGTGDWTAARHLVAQATGDRVDAGRHAGLYYGAPAILFMLNAATADGRDRYTAARQHLTPHVRRLVRDRLTDADNRLRHGQPATFNEYDLFYGLTGLGALLLRDLPDSDELGDSLTYVVGLTEPRTDDGQQLPGWWVDHDPDPLMPTPGGHANFGMAHGAAGLLALLALATRNGRQVKGQEEAIERLCAWFDQWQQDTTHGPWWPQWLTRDELRAGRFKQEVPGRPSWCYGAPGIARALQLAAIATNQPDRQVAAETALAASMTGPQLDRLTELGICHGLAGLYATAHRAVRDARTADIAAQLPTLAERLNQRGPSPDHPGLLTGQSGWSLALEAARTSTPPRTRWDTCLLIA
ncbi:MULTISPECIES: lanthionine synthetase C family protein [Micromonospora]|uniref:lanthionine synthetase C family protein n=1 Tax=Micromonospora TaxID=1873 RepID=UPI0001BF2EB2|nr:MULTISPECIES: lanthionine synthetase C family protein [Micromonospora]ADL49623.1 Lanthionine synthetase C family protein [Micromonospora aurantiaca ATCC 27029]